MKVWEANSLVMFEHHDARAVAGEQGGTRQTGDSASNDSDIVMGTPITPRKWRDALRGFAFYTVAS